MNPKFQQFLLLIVWQLSKLASGAMVVILNGWDISNEYILVKARKAKLHLNLPINIQSQKSLF